MHHLESTPTPSLQKSAETKSKLIEDDALYQQVISSIINSSLNSQRQQQLSDYVQKAFEITNDRHVKLLQSDALRPDHWLNVEIINAKDLMHQNQKRLINPFATIYMTSNPTHQQNTTTKQGTLNPTWMEAFSLPIDASAENDSLTIDLWDVDEVKSVNQEAANILEVDGWEIAVTTSTRIHDTVALIGRCQTPLKTIRNTKRPSWFNLDKNGCLKRNGVIQANLSISDKKHKYINAQEHRQLLHTLLEHEFNSSKPSPYSWSGQFSDLGQQVIDQHALHSGLDPAELAIIKWSVYTLVHHNQRLSFNIFNSVLDVLEKLIYSNVFNEPELVFFWDGVRRLLPSCFAVVRTLRTNTLGNRSKIQMLRDVLLLLSKLAHLEPPEGTDLFPMELYGWLNLVETCSRDINGALLAAVLCGTEDWFVHIKDHLKKSREVDENGLLQIIQLVQLVRSDIMRGIEFYDELFEGIMKCSYAQICYVYYESQLSEFVKPIILDVFRSLPSISDHTTIGTLFEVYMLLQKFLNFGQQISPTVADFKIRKYTRWFAAGVPLWLDMMSNQAQIRIENLVELDQLQPSAEGTKHSSSAVDVLCILNQIQDFLQPLSWPDAEDLIGFAGHIMDGIYRCSVVYADRMAVRSVSLVDKSKVEFVVTREWCTVLNNIAYIQQRLPLMLEKLQIQDIIVKLISNGSAINVEQSVDKIKYALDQTVDSLRAKILVLVETVVRKLAPAMKRFLVDGSELQHRHSDTLDRLMDYLEDSLHILNTELTSMNFSRVLDAMCDELKVAVADLVTSGLEKGRQQLYFSNLQVCVKILCTSINHTTLSDYVSLGCDGDLLQLHATETSDLIHQFYLEQYNVQRQMTSTMYGKLTVLYWFHGNSLKIFVNNGRQLPPMDSSGRCDPYVRIQFIPEDKFTDVCKPRTKTRPNSLFPLFDEHFTINLSPEQRNLNTALIRFKVKHEHMFGLANSEYVAECYVRFDRIGDESATIQETIQLSRPKFRESNCIRALRHRTYDKQAAQFIKKLYQKYDQQIPTI